MAQIKIEIPDEVHRILKERAYADDRSFHKYVQRLLRYFAEQPEQKITLSSASQSQEPVVPTRRRDIPPAPPREQSSPPSPSQQPEPQQPTHTNTLRDKMKIWLDTYDIHPKDHTMATFNKMKEKFTDMDIFTFDEIQHERAGD